MIGGWAGRCSNQCFIDSKSRYLADGMFCMINGHAGTAEHYFWWLISQQGPLTRTTKCRNQVLHRSTIISKPDFREYEDYIPCDNNVTKRRVLQAAKMKFLSIV